MTAVPRLLVGGALAVASAAALAALSNLPYTAERLDHAVIRFAWRARGERVRECRRLSPEELARLPQHMRQEEVCQRRVLPYRLRVVLDGRLLLDRVVRPGGAGADRPLFVFHELRTAPGTHALRVTFEREGAAPQPETGAGAEPRETPPRLELDRAIRLTARQIVLVTYDDEHQSLRLAGAD